MLTAEVLFIFALILANGVFAMAEIAVVTSRKVRLQQRAEGGDTRAAAALRLARDPTQFLSTVQVGITLIGIFAGAYGGVTLADALAERFARWPVVAPYGRALALAIVVTAITYLSLVIGELVPKAIALANPEGVASVVAAPLAGLARAATPVVSILSASTRLVLAALRVAPHADTLVTEEEIRALIKQATVSGEVAAVEQRIVEQVFHMGDRRVHAIMTPRHEIDWFDINDNLDHLRDHLEVTRHPRLVVCDGSPDKVLGILRAEELLARILAGERPDVRSLLKAPLFVPSTLSVFQLLERFRTSRVHMAFVLDEFGVVDGLVTPTDIFEGLVGEIPTDVDLAPGPIHRRDERSWLVDGTAAFEDLAREVSLPDRPEGEAGAYHTVAGFVMARLSRVPHTGDRFTWGDCRFEVVDMDGRRVDKVLVERVPAAGDTASNPA